jgi:hypothetical protein
MAQGKKFKKEEVIASLEPLFRLGYSIDKACSLAKFTPSTVYRWAQQEPELATHIKSLQAMVGAKARKNVATAINKGDVQSSRWWLERAKTDREDFKTRTEPTLVAENMMIKITNYGDREDEIYEVRPEDHEKINDGKGDMPIK